MLDLDTAKQTLAPFFGPINQAILEGFNHRKRAYGDETSKHTPRTRASLVHDLIVDEARKRLPGVRVFQVHNRILFDLGVADLQFKKLQGGSLVASNYPTQFALLFNSQELLPGFLPDKPRIIAGYVPSEDWSQVESTHITMPMGDEVAWQIPLVGEETQIRFTQENDGDDTRLNKRRFRKKGTNGGISLDETGTGVG